MNRETEILQTLKKILEEHCDLKEVELKPEQRLQEDLGLDSMGLLSLSVEIENFYQLYLNEDVSNPPRTIGEVVKLIDQRVSESKQDE